MKTRMDRADQISSSGGVRYAPCGIVPPGLIFWMKVPPPIVVLCEDIMVVISAKLPLDFDVEEIRLQASKEEALSGTCDSTVYNRAWVNKIPLKKVTA